VRIQGRLLLRACVPTAARRQWSRVALRRSGDGGRRRRLERCRPRWHALGRLLHSPGAPHVPPPQQLGAWGEDAEGGIGGAPGGGIVGGGEEGEELVLLVRRGWRRQNRRRSCSGGIPATFLEDGSLPQLDTGLPVTLKITGPKGKPEK
jgi:hypothetical protein